MLPVNTIPGSSFSYGVSAADSSRRISQTNQYRTNQSEATQTVDAIDTVQLPNLYSAQQIHEMMYIMGSGQLGIYSVGPDGALLGGAAEEGQADSESVLAYEDRAGDASVGSLAGLPASGTRYAPATAAFPAANSGTAAEASESADGEDSEPAPAGNPS